VAQGRRDIGPASGPEDVQQGIAAGRQSVGRVTGVHLMRILPHRDIAHVMHPILTRPMATPQLLNHRTCRRPRQTRHGIGDRLRDGTRFEQHPFTLPSDHVLHSGPVQLVIEVVTTGKRPLLQPSMPFMDGVTPVPRAVTRQRGRVKLPREFLVELGVVAFDHHEVMPTLLHYLGRKLRMR
jgi:hypothetical protein